MMDIMNKFIAVCKAMVSRLLFTAHGAIVCWRVYEAIGSEIYGGVLAIPLALLPVEMIVTLRFSKHGEWKWLSPALLLYLLCVVPGIGVLQIDLHNRRMKLVGSTSVEECKKAYSNVTHLPPVQSTLSQYIGNVDGIFTLTDWPVILEQTTMFLVILGRWMLPKGALTRDQLSQLLLVYIGMAADILEFSSESLDQPVVGCDLVIICVVIAIWGVSLCQFALVLTSVAGPKVRNFSGKRDNSRSAKESDDTLEQVEVVKKPTICGSEIWSLLLVLAMQDCPFLAVRVYLLVTIHEVNRTMIFFAGKNILMFLLTAYRIIVLCLAEHGETAKVSPEPLGMETLPDRKGDRDERNSRDSNISMISSKPGFFARRTGPNKWTRTLGTQTSPVDQENRSNTSLDNSLMGSETNLTDLID